MSNNDNGKFTFTANADVLTKELQPRKGFGSNFSLNW